jgi:hypothetical protein
MLIRGQCHCGNIAFDLEWNEAPPVIPARACRCTFCVKHGGVWTSNPRSTLTVTLADPSRVSKYEFGTRTALFHVCSRCGAVPLVTSEIDGHVYAVVNVNTFENVDAAWLRPSATSFDGEAIDARLARRRRNWIADVRMEVQDGGRRSARTPSG